MKLAFCLFNYFPYGGLQRDFLRIARVCHERGHEIHVYTMQQEGDVDLPIHWHLLPQRKFSNHTRVSAFAKAVKLHLDKNEYDAVVGFNKMPNLDIYYAADVCYAARIHTSRHRIYQWLPRYKTLAAMERSVFAYGQATEILLIAAQQQPAFITHYQTEAKRFHLLPPGISKDRMAPVDALERRIRLRQHYQLTDKDFMLLMVGSGFKTKGLDRAIISLASLPEIIKKRCRLFIIGQDRSQPFVKLAKKLQVFDRLYFLGGRADVADFYLAADLLLHPAYHENTGTVLLEALASGLPVLTNDVCGYAHYINTAEGGVVLPSPFQQIEFNLSLQKMLLSPNLKTWGQNGCHWAKFADIYSLPEKAADFIEQYGAKKHRVTA